MEAREANTPNWNRGARVLSPNCCDGAGRVARVIRRRSPLPLRAGDGIDRGVAPLPLNKFLIVEDQPEGQCLLERTLKRKFPRAIIQPCTESLQATERLKQEKWDAVIVHRSADLDGIEVTRQLRELDAHIIIVMVSGRPKEKEALAAGANLFLQYDQWLLVGTLVAELLAKQATRHDPRVSAQDACNKPASDSMSP